jgi:hypothetical protein
MKESTYSYGHFAKLAKAVLSGQLKSCAWQALKALYFKGTDDEQCMARLVEWANHHHIELEFTGAKVTAPGIVPIMAYTVHFKVPPTTPFRAKVGPQIRSSSNQAS